MSAKVVVLVLFALLMLGIMIFRYRGGVNTLHVEPHAAEEIEKAKQR